MKYETIKPVNTVCHRFGRIVFEAMPQILHVGPRVSIDNIRETMKIRRNEHKTRIHHGLQPSSRPPKVVFRLFIFSVAQLASVSEMIKDALSWVQGPGHGENMDWTIGLLDPWSLDYILDHFLGPFFWTIFQTIL